MKVPAKIQNLSMNIDENEIPNHWLSLCSELIDNHSRFDTHRRCIGFRDWSYKFKTNSTLYKLRIEHKSKLGPFACFLFWSLTHTRKRPSVKEKNYKRNRGFRKLIIRQLTTYSCCSNCGCGFISCTPHGLKSAHVSHGKRFSHL